MTFQHLWRVMLQYSWLVMAVASHGTAQPLMPTAPHETSHRPHQDTHTSRHRTKTATSNVAKKNPKGHAGKVWSLVLLAGGVMALFVYSSLQDPSTRIPDSQVPSLGQLGRQHALHKPVQQFNDPNTLHTITPKAPSKTSNHSQVSPLGQEGRQHVIHKPVQQFNDPKALHITGPKGLSNTSTDSQVPSLGQVGRQHALHKPVQLSSDSNPFDALVFGAQEKAWHASLGPLPDNVKIEDYELNPAFLAADILPETECDEVKQYPLTFDTSCKQLLDLLKRANFRDDATFPSPYDEEEQDYQGSSCNEDTVVHILQPDTFIPKMNKKKLKEGIARMFNYVVDKMHALDIGLADQADKDLSDVQLKNRSDVRNLLRMLPRVYKECDALTKRFNADTVNAIGLKSVKPLHFPAKVYVYLKKILKGYLDPAISQYLIKMRAKVHQYSIDKSYQDFSCSLFREHAIIALEYACKDHIKLPNRILPQESFFYVPIWVNGMAKKNNISSGDEKNIVQDFLHYFRTTYAKDVFKELKAVTLNAYYGDVPLNSYVEFAQEKGLGRDVLFVKDTYQTLAPNPFLGILVNIKLLTPKSSQA